MHSLISVIVPVYRVEQYLEKCIESIVNQTYSNLEILLVDDGSPDRCPELCDAWAERDTRIRVVHQPNGGLSAARNSGMAAATGEYIGFVDSDDYLAPDMYEKLLQLSIESGKDISACGVQMLWENSERAAVLTSDFSGTLTNEEAMEEIIKEDKLKMPVWNKLYRREVIQDLPFPEGKHHEDAFWTYQAIAASNGVAVSAQKGYYYLQRSSSIMGMGYSLSRLHAVEAAAGRQLFLNTRYPKLAEQGKVKLFEICLYHGQKAISCLKGRERRNALGFLKEIQRRNMLDRETVSGLKTTHKIWYRLSQTAFGLTCRLRNLLKIGC